MMASHNKQKVAYIGLLIAFALILSYVESLIPFFFGIPGMKLGLANLAVLLTLYLFGWKDALFVSVCRILLASFMFGNMSVLLYSLAGGILSFCVMFLFRRSNLFSMVGTSMGGGVFHNIGQLLVAFAVVHTKGLLYYTPVLLLAGLVTGFWNGILASLVYEKLSIGKGKV